MPFIPMAALLVIGALVWLKIDPARELIPYATKMLATLSQLRNVFQGTVRLFDICFPGTLSNNFAALFDAVDVLQVELVDPKNFVTPEENTNLTLPLVKAKMKDFLAQWTQRLAPFSLSKPLYAIVQSQRDTLASGWVEDCCCVDALGAPASPPNAMSGR